MEYALNLPLNSVSFGQVSFGILRYLHEINHQPSIFTIGNPDVSSQNIDQNFGSWLQSNINKAIKTHKRDTQILKLWHLNGGLESFSKKQNLLTFYELDSPTEEEINIIKNQNSVLVTNKYAQNIFSLCGCDNVKVVPLYFDKYNFYVKNKNFFNDGRITFNVVGKFEKRKNHEKLIKLWIKKYGNNPKYFLNCAIYNPFISPEDNQKIWHHICGGIKYFNVDFLGLMPKNEMYNDFLNSGDIVFALGTEGWGLPEFHSVALGKHAIVLNCAGYKEWANDKNSILINPNSKQEVYDGMFFHKGQPFNQGNIFSFSDDDFYKAIDLAVNRFKQNKINVEGLKLQENFTVQNTVTKILETLE